MDYDRKQLESKATAALVLGILSIVCALGGMSLLGTILGIIGIVQGAKSKDFEANGKAGFVCSIIGTVLGSGLLIILVALAGFVMIPMCLMPFWFLF